MAFSIVQICNDALQLCPAERIEAFDEDSLSARECRQAFPFSKAAILAANAEGWSFARQAVVPPVTANPLPTEWRYAFALDAEKELLRVTPQQDEPDSPQAIYARGMAGYPVDEAIPFTVAGGILLTNIARPLVLYRLTEVTEDRLTLAAAMALSYDLASRICLPITKDQRRHNSLLGMAQMKLNEAIADDWSRSSEPWATALPATYAADRA